MAILRLRDLLCTSLMLCSILAAQAADAETDIERAARLFKEGRAAMTAGDPATACPKFEQAQRLDPGPGTLLNLGLCEEALGKLASAFEHLKAVVTQVPPEDQRAKYAAEKADAIALKLPRLRISLAAGAPEDTAIQHDGEPPVAFRNLGGQILVDAGEHTIVVTATGRLPRSYRVSLGPGEVKSLVVEAGEAAQPSSAPVEPRAPGWTTQAKLGFVSIGVGGALLATGVATGVVVLGDKSTVQNDCHGTSVCDTQAGADASRQGRTFSVVSTVGFIGGGALAGVGVALVLTGRARATTPVALVPSPGGIACVGAF